MTGSVGSGRISLTRLGRNSQVFSWMSDPQYHFERCQVCFGHLVWDSEFRDGGGGKFGVALSL